MERAEAPERLETMTTMKTRIAVALAAAAMALSPAVSLADDAGSSLEQLAVEMAKTPDQHAALARYYREKAEEARSEAARHESMAKTYAGGGGKASQRQSMKRHCDEIAMKYTEIAKDYDALAKDQDEEAKTAK